MACLLLCLREALISQAVEIQNMLCDAKLIKFHALISDHATETVC